MQDTFRTDKSKMRGCIGYDCFGAGQKVTQVIYNSSNWHTKPTKAQEMYDVFLAIFQLHQILYFLAEAKTIIPARALWDDINVLVKEGREVCNSTPHYILAYNIEKYKGQVNETLKKSAI